MVNNKIRKLGVNYVAEQCGVKPPAVSYWLREGVPKVRLTQLKTLWPGIFGKPKKAKKKGR